jgi:hypothetical protein
MALNLRQTVVDFLKLKEEERFSAREIAQWIFENFSEACEEKRQQSKQDLTSDLALIQQLSAEISTNRSDIQKRHPQVKTTESRPRQYYYSTLSDKDEVARVESGDPQAKAQTGKPPKLLEHELYPLLCTYLNTEFHIFPKRIDEKKSSNKQGPNGNKWLYPDIVGMEDLSSKWDIEVRECVARCGDKRVRLWSFEVKLLLNRSNLREAWFQTVSNSSWANMGYLVTKEIEGEGTMQELQMLSASHGIGLIRLNAENPIESEILIPARERTEIDWNVCNRLTTENTDFRFFVKLVRQFHQTGDPRPGDWDN